MAGVAMNDRLDWVVGVYWFKEEAFMPLMYTKDDREFVLAGGALPKPRRQHCEELKWNRPCYSTQRAMFCDLH